MGIEIKFKEASERKISVVTVPDIQIPLKNDGFRKGSYTKKITEILTEGSEKVGDLAKIGGNERFEVSTKKGIVEGSFMPTGPRDTLHQETIEGVKSRIMTGKIGFNEGKDSRKMEDDYCIRYNIAQ